MELKDRLYLINYNLDTRDWSTILKRDLSIGEVVCPISLYKKYGTLKIFEFLSFELSDEDTRVEVVYINALFIRELVKDLAVHLIYAVPTWSAGNSLEILKVIQNKKFTYLPKFYEDYFEVNIAESLEYLIKSNYFYRDGQIITNIL